MAVFCPASRLSARALSESHAPAHVSEDVASCAFVAPVLGAPPAHRALCSTCSPFARRATLLTRRRAWGRRRTAEVVLACASTDETNTQQSAAESLPVVGAGMREEFAKAREVDRRIQGDFDLEANRFRADIPVINSVVLTGRLGQDPVLRQVSVGGNGKRKVSLVTFSVAVRDDAILSEIASVIAPDESWDRNDPRATTWHNCEVWGASAEAAARQLRKGIRVGVQGMLGFSSYVNRDGVPVDSHVISVRNWEVLQSKSEGDGESARDAYDGPGRASQHARGYDPMPSAGWDGSASADGSRQRRPARAETSRKYDDDEEDDGLPF